MVRIITADMLREKRACAAQLRVFEEMFPNGAEVSEALARQLHDVFVWGWAAEHLLTPSARKAYSEAMATAETAYNEAADLAWRAYNEATASARKAYSEAADLAWRAYNEVRASHAWEAYNEATASARKAYNEAADLAWRAYNEATASHAEAYDEAKATAFARAYLADAQA